MSKQTILITGGGGNLARQLSHGLLAEGHRVIAVDLPPSLPSDGAGRPRAEYHSVDVTEPGRLKWVMEATRPDQVIHFASLLSGDSEADRPRAWQVNVGATFEVFEAAVATGVAAVFFPSSVAAYGGPLPDPVPLDHPQWPLGLYGVTKACVERLGVYYHDRFGLDFRCLRLPVVVSRFAPAGAASAYASRCFIEAAGEGRYTFRVRPETSPSVIYVKDALHAIRQLIMASSAQLTRRVYNIQALAPTAGELSQVIERRLPDAELTFEPDSEVVELIESWPVRFDDTAARADWGWAPRYQLEAMADDLLEELLEDTQDGDADGAQLLGAG